MSNQTVLPILRAVGTAVPDHCYPQADIADVMYQLFPHFSSKHRYREVFSNTQIEQRYVCMPLDWYVQPLGFGAKNAQYNQHALDLAETAARLALSRSQLSAADIDAVLWVSTTGIRTPSPDAALMQRLGIDSHSMRLPIWGLGCAGGAAGLARASDLVRAGYQNVLLVCVELCSLTFIRQDESLSNFVGSALFSDGAAAVIVSAKGTGLELHGHYSTLIPNSEDIMGWDVSDDGLNVRFSRDIPSLVREMMNNNVHEATAKVGWQRADVQHFVIHPGGSKVLSAYQDALQLSPLDDALHILQHYGNMSSATVLFVLERFLAKQHLRKDVLQPEAGVLSAMGPGFSAEHVLFKRPIQL